MRYLRPSFSGHVPGVGFVHAGNITTIPDHLADEFLATGEWEDATPAPARVTEVPAPTPAKAPRAKKGR